MNKNNFTITCNL